MGIVKNLFTKEGDFSLCKKYLPFFVTPNEVRGARLSLGMTKKDALAWEKGKGWLRTAGEEAFSMTWERMLGDKKALLGMQEEGCSGLQGSFTLLTKRKFWIKLKIMKKYPLTKF